MPSTQEALKIAVASIESGDWVAAETKARDVLRCRPTHVAALHILGRACSDRGDDVEAIRLFRQAISTRPDFLPAYRSLSRTFMALRRIEDATVTYRRWLELQPDEPEAQHMLAATAGEGAPSKCSELYVSTIFDQFAGSFDTVLVKSLGYRGPQLIESALASAIDEANDLQVLDAGCGTGLCGPTIRPRCRNLIGVDLSSKMLERARERDCYDELITAEICAFMHSRRDAFDVVIAADVLIYFGDLEVVMSAAFATLKNGGWFVFTVEAMPNETADPYRLLSNGRYCHSAWYLRRAIAEAGLLVQSLRAEVARFESGAKVAGYTVVASKPS